jgi:hypothetical protein
MSGWMVVLFAIGVALASILVWRLVESWAKYRGRAVVRCPEDHKLAGVSIDVSHAVVTSLIGSPELRLAACSHWPTRAGCGQQCLRQIEESPQDCLVRNILVRWYEGKSCAWCGRPIGDIHLAERKPALLTANRTSLEWAEIPAECLQQTLLTALPLCFGCHISNRMIRTHPELVIDRSRPVVPGRLARTGRPAPLTEPFIPASDSGGLRLQEDDTVLTHNMSHTKGDRAIAESQKSGSNAEKLRMIGSQNDRGDGVLPRYHEAVAQMNYWMRFGAGALGIWAFTLGVAFLLARGIKPALVAGGLTPALLGVLVEVLLVVSFLTLIGAGLYSLGIPEKGTPEHEAKVQSTHEPGLDEVPTPNVIKAA